MRFSDAEIDDAVAKMYSTGRVRNFIRNAERRKDAYAATAGERRIKEILLDELEDKSDFHREFMRYVTAYEKILSEENIKKKTATRTRQRVLAVGAVQTMINLLEKPPKTYGIELLARKGRLDCAYENIVYDYPEFFLQKHRDEAQRRLGPVKHLLPPFPILRDRT